MSAFLDGQCDLPPLGSKAFLFDPNRSSVVGRSKGLEKGRKKGGGQMFFFSAIHPIYPFFSLLVEEFRLAV